uniref:Uncharacterized protein n=1 Tax=Saccharomyces pastorianus TaxID=27292 RepID=P78997_SACPS|nr:unknown [Saccharomyces pastorianus]
MSVPHAAPWQRTPRHFCQAESGTGTPAVPCAMAHPTNHLTVSVTHFLRIAELASKTKNIFKALCPRPTGEQCISHIRSLYIQSLRNIRAHHLSSNVEIVVAKWPPQSRCLVVRHYGALQFIVDLRVGV